MCPADVIHMLSLILLIANLIKNVMYTQHGQKIFVDADAEIQQEKFEERPYMV